MTVDQGTATGLFEEPFAFDRSIVYLKAGEGDVEQDDAIDPDCSPAYKRLTPGRLYTVTGSRECSAITLARVNSTGWKESLNLIFKARNCRVRLGGRTLRHCGFRAHASAKADPTHGEHLSCLSW